MLARKLGNRQSARIRFRNDPRLRFARPAPPPAYPSDHFDAPNAVTLGVKRRVTHMVKPGPAKENRIIPHWAPLRYVGKELRLPSSISATSISRATRSRTTPGAGPLAWERLALTREQVREYDLPVIIKRDRRAALLRRGRR